MGNVGGDPAAMESGASTLSGSSCKLADAGTITQASSAAGAVGDAVDAVESW